MLTTVWGTRGSVPSPGLETVRYGGNTPCVEVQLSDGTEIILGAGTGIRPLGRELMRRGARPPRLRAHGPTHTGTTSTASPSFGPPTSPGGRSA